MESKLPKEREKRDLGKVISAVLYGVAAALWIVGAVFFVVSSSDSDHSRFFAACVFVFAGGVSALVASFLAFRALKREAKNRNAEKEKP